MLQLSNQQMLEGSGQPAMPMHGRRKELRFIRLTTVTRQWKHPVVDKKNVRQIKVRMLT